MGLNLMFSRGSTDASAPPQPPNPSPFRFEVLVTERIGDAIIALIHYQDCTTFDGNKLCLYASAADFHRARAAKCLDPHILGKNETPFARFEPTPAGLELARLCADALKEKK